MKTKTGTIIMKSNLLLAGAVALACLVGGTPANAAVVTVDGAFQATGWQVYFGTPSAPIDPLYLNYSVTFDDSLTYEANTSLLTINSTNIPYSMTFSYTNGNIVLATDGSSGSCMHIPSSFCAFIPTSTGIATFVEQSPASGGWYASTITAGAVPEPATWVMMLAGFGMLGFAMRARREGVVAAV